MASVRVAIIADIHGNYHALDAVLTDLAELDVDEIIVNGDSVNRGPDSARVMQRLRNIPHQHILGNHDDLLVIAHEPPDTHEWLLDPFWSSVRYASKELHDAGLLDQFRNMEQVFRFDHGGQSILVSHGSPRHYREGLGKFLRSEVLSEILAEHPTDILIGSHTHRQYIAHWGPHTVLNTGAVGMPFNGDQRAQYLLLTKENDTWTWTFRRIPYDADAAIEHFLRTEYYKQGGLSTEIYLTELRNARSYYAPFTMWATEFQHELDEKSWAEFQQRYADRFVAAEMKQEVSETKEVL